MINGAIWYTTPCRGAVFILAAAEFIRGNVPEDALLVSDTDDRVVFAAYLPEREIYALKHNRFYTCCSHEVYDAPLDKEKLKRLCDEHYEVYFIANATPERPEWERVYENSNCVPFVFSEDTVAIYKVTAGDLFEQALIEDQNCAKAPRRAMDGAYALWKILRGGVEHGFLAWNLLYFVAINPTPYLVGNAVGIVVNVLNSYFRNSKSVLKKRPKAEDFTGACSH